MDFNEYQKTIKKYDFFEATDDVLAPGFVAKVLGLAGEAGEVAEKFKKIIRDKNGVISKDDKDTIKKELGDVLWYTATISRYLDIPLSEVADANLEKLESRRQRDKLHGEGDNR